MSAASKSKKKYVVKKNRWKEYLGVTILVLGSSITFGVEIVKKWNEPPPTPALPAPAATPAQAPLAAPTIEHSAPGSENQAMPVEISPPRSRAGALNTPPS